VVGESDLADGSAHAFRTVPDAAINPATDDLGTLGGANSGAASINALGQAVGDAQTADGAYHAFFSAGGPMQDLNTLLPADSGWVLEKATAINDGGEIVGYGIHNGVRRGFLLIHSDAPPPPPNTPIPTNTPMPTDTPTPVGPHLAVTPDTILADGSSAATITLSGAQSGDRVHLTSTLDGVDGISPPTGVVDDKGRYSATIRSTRGGTSLIRVDDLTTGQVLNTSAQVTFTGHNTPSPDPQRIAIIKVEGECPDADCPVGGFYATGLDLTTRMRATVDWKGHARGAVDFMLDNRLLASVHDDGKGAEFDFKIKDELTPGPHVLSIVARSCPASSLRKDVYLVGYALPQWITDGLSALDNTVPAPLDHQALTLRVAIPGQPLCHHENFVKKQDCEKDGAAWGFPGDLNNFQFQTIVTLRLPLRGGAFEAAVDMQRNRAQTGRQPKSFLKALGHNFDMDFTGKLSGVLKPDAPYVVPQDVEIGAEVGCADPKTSKIKSPLVKTLAARCSGISFTWSRGLLDLLQNVVPEGTAIATALGQVGPVKDWLNQRAEVYVHDTVGKSFRRAYFSGSLTRS